MHWSKLVRAVLKIEVVEHELEEDLKRMIGSAFGVSEFEYSVFEGTPSVHQKTTIQVWKGEWILGYVKMSENEEVGRLFFREAEFLKKITDDRLQITHFVRDFYSARHNEQAPSALANRKNIQITDNTDICVEKSRRDDITQTGVRKLRVSECNEIYFGCQAGAIWTESTPGRDITPQINPVGVTGLVPEAEAFRVRNGEVFVLIQTTRKSLKSVVVHEWGVLQEEFLKRLYVATAKEIVWEESEVAQALRDLRELVDWLPDGVDGDVVARRIDAVMERMVGKRVMYGAYHGDFTPWNMFVEGGELFVFDWEYAGMSYPMGLDRYHFWMQTALFEKHWGVEELKRYMGSDEGKWIDREMLEMYLLDVMSKYVMREGEKVKSLGAFEVWCGMVKGK